MALRLGDLELSVISGGAMRLDGGTMFGVVPRMLWERKSVPDDRNRIRLDTNCLLVRTGGRHVLIDTGYGDKPSQRQRDHLALEAGRPLVANLARAGLDPDQIDAVVLTHLHFDHAGGCTVSAGSRMRPTFPNATYYVQQAEWEDATACLPELAGSYAKGDCVPLDEAGVLRRVTGNAEPMPGVSLRLAGGHTRGHQIVILGTGRNRAVCPGDLCPTYAHLPTHWTMSYDQYPLDVRRSKSRVLGEAADEGWLVLFSHDPDVKAAYLERNEKSQFAVREAVTVESAVTGSL